MDSFWVRLTGKIAPKTNEFTDFKESSFCDQLLKIFDSHIEIKFPVLTNEEVARLGLRPPDVLPTTYLLSPDGEAVAKLIGMQTDAEIREQLLMKGALLDEAKD